MDLAHVVESRRRDLRLTQLDAAELAGVSERFVRDVEAGKITVRLDKVQALMAALGLELTTRARR
ncbi:type II toxin-antitoxin system Y4mF family antitoxin [Tessaracoccus sp. G1721]